MRWQQEAERGGVRKDVQQEAQWRSLRTESQWWGGQGGGEGRGRKEEEGVSGRGPGPGGPGQKMSAQPSQFPCSLASQ